MMRGDKHSVADDPAPPFAWRLHLVVWSPAGRAYRTLQQREAYRTQIMIPFGELRGGWIIVRQSS